jgi:hypothetical protein
VGVWEADAAHDHYRSETHHTMAKEQKKQKTTGQSGNAVCSVHGAEHEYNVQCRMDPVWTSIYIYRTVCKCGVVQRDWHQ